MNSRWSSLFTTVVAGLMVVLSACNSGSGSSPTEPPAGPQPVTRIELTPPCPIPAPLSGQYYPEVPGFIVDLKDGVNVREATQTLGRKYGFTPTSVYDVLGGFATPDLTPQVVAQLRCEPVIELIHYNGIAYLF